MFGLVRFRAFAREQRYWVGDRPESFLENAVELRQGYSRLGHVPDFGDPLLVELEMRFQRNFCKAKANPR